MNRSEPTAAEIEATLHRIRALSRPQHRQRERCFCLEGVRHFVQAFDADLHFDAIVYSPVLLKCPLAEKIIRRLGARGVRRLRVTPEQFRSVATAERASGVAAIARQH